MEAHSNARTGRRATERFQAPSRACIAALGWTDGGAAAAQAFASRVITQLAQLSKEKFA